MAEIEQSSDDERDGRLVYNRTGANGPGDGRVGTLDGLRAEVRGALWQALVPLIVGFSLLIGLVIGLGILSANKVRDISFDTQDDYRRLAATSNHLLNLRLALNRLHTEARIRGKVEAGTEGVMNLPTDLRVRNERAAVEDLLPEFDKLQLGDPARKTRARARIEEYAETTKDVESYSLRGFPLYRDLDEELRALSAEVGGQQQEIEERLDDALEGARAEIRFLMMLAALTGLIVASATFLEVFRRFRQMRRSNLALQRERQFSAQMLGGMPSAVAAIDRNDRIRSANTTFFDVFPGASVGASVHNDFDAPESMKLLEAATAERVSRATYQGRWPLQAAGGDGRVRTFDVYSSPLEIDGENGQLLTLVDVTEAAEAERDLRRQESLAAVGRAAAQVAHEIKNPLGSIRLGVAMLRDMTSDRQAITTIDLIERGIEHLSKITLDVTQFSRRRELSLAETELHTLLDESLDLIMDKLREKRTSVERLYADDGIEADWDEDQLRQVFVNLLANAVDASDEKSPLRITTERVSVGAGARVDGEGGRRADGVRIVIEDRGAGMDEQTRARIFEPFFTTKKRGTGLGLSIARQIIEQHDGTIRVDSRPGEGTRFTIELPLSPIER